MTNELSHREEKKDHKYIAKVEKGKKTRYFYSKEEWLAYLKGDKSTQQETKKTATKSFADLVSGGKNLLSSLFKDNTTSKDSKKSEAASSIKAAVAKVVSEGQKFVSSVTNKVDKAVTKKQADKGKDYLSDKQNENLGALFIIPTSTIIDVIDRIVDAFSKDDKDEDKKKQEENVAEEKILEEKILEEDVLEENILEENIPEWASNLERQDEELTHDENQALINPEYNMFIDDYSMNCAYCTAAYDLRMRGYDVEAMPFDPDTYVSNMYDISSWYENTTVDDWTNTWKYTYVDPESWDVTRIDHNEVIKRTEEALANMPDDSYGQFCVYWNSGGGHSMVWARENGNTVIRDCQTNETYSYAEWIETYGDYTQSTHILRTDNREPSMEILKTVRNREEDDD